MFFHLLTPAEWNQTVKDVLLGNNRVQFTAYQTQ